MQGKPSRTTREIVSLDFPLFVKWYITTKCNLRCGHCYLTNYDHRTDLASILEIADYLATNGVQGIVLIGGEPLIRMDLEQIVRRLTRHGIRLKIATNGILASAERSTSLMRSGARAFQVSIEGPSRRENDQIRGRNTFDAVFAGCRELVSAGGSVSLAVTISKQNYHRILEIFELAHDARVQKIKFNAFIPMGTGVALADNFSLTSEICQAVTDHIEETRKRFPAIEVESGAFSRRIIVRDLKSTSRLTMGCGAGTSTLVINSDLTLSACDMSVETDRTTQSIKKLEDIATLWNNDIVFQKWRGKFNDRNQKDFTLYKDVHGHGCNVAYNIYKKNVFENE